MGKKKAKSGPTVVTESTDLHEVFRAVIDQSGMTRAEIAQILGIAESSLSRPYNGHRGVSWDLLQSVAKATGMRVVATAER